MQKAIDLKTKTKKRQSSYPVRATAGQRHSFVSEDDGRRDAEGCADMQVDM